MSESSSEEEAKFCYELGDEVGAQGVNSKSKKHYWRFKLTLEVHVEVLEVLGVELGCLEPIVDLLDAPLVRPVSARIGVSRILRIIGQGENTFEGVGKKEAEEGGRFGGEINHSAYADKIDTIKI